MNVSAFTQSIAAIFLALASFCFVSRAETIVVPNANATVAGPGAGLSLPFTANSRWQQVYMSPEFSSVGGDIIEVRELRFRIDEMSLSSSFSTVARGLSIFMSTTTRTRNTASTAYSENIEGNLFSALPQTDIALTGSRSSATSFDVVIPLPNRYQYDRRTGNLLIDIQTVGGANLPFLDQQGFLPEATFSIGGALDAATGTRTSQGLVTQFTFEVVPEPKSWVLLIVACALLIIRRKHSYELTRRVD